MPFTRESLHPGGGIGGLSARYRIPRENPMQEGA